MKTKAITYRLQNRKGNEMAQSMKDRLDGLPLSRWHWKVMLICSLGFLFDGKDNMMISFAFRY